MKAHLLAVGTHMPSWVQEGYEEYGKRLPSHYQITLTEIPLSKRHKNAPAALCLQEEETLLLKHIDERDWVVALDVKGRSFSTLELAEEIKKWQLQGNPLKFLIGGPHGLSPQCIARAHQTWSLSSLTFPHPLVRILFAEQWYRAYTLISGHPYHR